MWAKRNMTVIPSVVVLAALCMSTPAAAGPRPVTLWSYSAQNQTQWNSIKSSVEAKFNITLTIVAVPENLFLQKLQGAMMDGKGYPDIIDWRLTNHQVFDSEPNRCFVHSLTKYTSRSKIFQTLKEVNSDLAARTTIGSHVYGLPRGSSFLGIVKLTTGVDQLYAVIEHMQYHNGVPVATAEDLATKMMMSIRRTHRSVVYGIDFAPQTAQILPGSETGLEAVHIVLQNDPQMKLYVVGHTEDVGAIDGNLKLSLSRADAVVKALSERHGVDASRLRPFGVGPLAPLASNQTEEGRARNRRLEIIWQRPVGGLGLPSRPK
jgi:outer membrane protein OmpA-like peptidoglycan-associated protein